jgi:hypothetical protein
VAVRRPNVQQDTPLASVQHLTHDVPVRPIVVAGPTAFGSRVGRCVRSADLGYVISVRFLSYHRGNLGKSSRDITDARDVRA